MSFIYRVVLQCDSCDDEFDMQEATAAPEVVEPKKLPPGWKANVEDEAMGAQYGHACPRCIKDIKEGT